VVRGGGVKLRVKLKNVNIASVLVRHVEGESAGNQTDEEVSRQKTRSLELGTLEHWNLEVLELHFCGTLGIFCTGSEV